MESKQSLFTTTLVSNDIDKMLVIRHGRDDESIITQNLDNNLIEDGLSDIKNLSDEIAGILRLSTQYSHVQLLHSPKLRTHQTASLIAYYLNGCGIPIAIRGVDELKELYQGEIVQDNKHGLEEKAAILHHAWLLYGDAVEKCDLFYQFGDPARDVPGIPTGKLDGMFTHYGENQLDFTKRIYAFVRDILQHDFGDSLPVIIGHRASVTKIQRILGACSIARGYAGIAQPGNLMFTERKVQRIKTDHAQGVIMPLYDRRLARNIIERELHYLHQQD